MRSAYIALVLLALSARPALPQGSDSSATAGIEAFNRVFEDATRRMDNAAIVQLWEEDGVSLLPSIPPLIGRQAIAAFIEDVTARLGGARMDTFTNECSGIEVSGSWGSEWCVQHQVVVMSDGRRFDAWGKMLLVLHRGSDGRWRLDREMWNQALAPGPPGDRG